MKVIWKKGKARIHPDHQYRGYWLDGELQIGFPDNPELTARERLFIARWAEGLTPESLSPEQERLLAEAPPPPSFLPVQAEFAQNQLDLCAPGISDLYDALSDEEQEVVRDPSRSPRRPKARYPLTVSDLAAIAGLSARKIHSWADDGLLPVFRERRDRRFYSAALIRAFVLQRTPSLGESAAAAAVAKSKAA